MSIDFVLRLSQVSGIPARRLLLDDLVGAAADVPHRYDHGGLSTAFYHQGTLCCPGKLCCWITIFIALL